MTTNSGVLSCTAGLAAGDLGMLQGIEPIYLISDCVDVAFTAKFAPPQAGVQQVVGVGDNEAGIFVGYNGLQFGCATVSGGNMQYTFCDIQGVATLAGTLTVTLNGTAVSYPVAVGMTASQVAASIVKVPPAGFLAYTQDTGVWFMSLFPQPITVLPTAGSTAVGVVVTISNVISGSVPQTSWAYEGSWNGAPLSGMDWTTGNRFRLRIPSTGYGATEVHVTNPLTCTSSLINQWVSTGTNSPLFVPQCYWPSIYVQNLAGSNAAVTVQTAGFDASGTNYKKVLRDQIGTQASAYISTFLSPTQRLLTVTNSIVFAGIRNRRLLLCRSLWVCSNLSVTSALTVIPNATISAGASRQLDPNSAALLDTLAGVSVSGAPCKQWQIPAGAYTTCFSLEDWFLPPLATLTVSIQSSVVLSGNIGVTLSWSEC